jgi:hypothetical protein
MPQIPDLGDGQSGAQDVNDNFQTGMRDGFQALASLNQLEAQTLQNDFARKTSERQEALHQKNVEMAENSEDYYLDKLTKYGVPVHVAGVAVGLPKAELLLAVEQARVEHERGEKLKKDFGSAGRTLEEAAMYLPELMPQQPAAEEGQGLGVSTGEGQEPVENERVSGMRERLAAGDEEALYEVQALQPLIQEAKRQQLQNAQSTEWLDVATPPLIQEAIATEGLNVDRALAAHAAGVIAQDMDAKGEYNPARFKRNVAVMLDAMSIEKTRQDAVNFTDSAVSRFELATKVLESLGEDSPERQEWAGIVSRLGALAISGGQPGQEAGAPPAAQPAGQPPAQTPPQTKNA